MANSSRVSGHDSTDLSLASVMGFMLRKAFSIPRKVKIYNCVSLGGKNLTFLDLTLQSKLHFCFVSFCLFSRLFRLGKGGEVSCMAAKHSTTDPMFLITISKY